LYLDTFTGYSGSVTLDFNANGVGVTFGEPLEIPPGTFDSGIDKYLPKQDPPPYTAYDTSGILKDWDILWDIMDDHYRSGGQGILNGLNCITDLGIGTVNLFGLGPYNGTSWAVNQLGGENPYVWIPMPDWSRNWLYKESGDPGAWNDTHGWSKFSGNVGFAALTMGRSLSGTALGETPITQLPKLLRSNAAEVAGEVVTNCFTAGTQVVVGAEYDEDGNFVSYVTANIEDIKVGDLVYSYDTATGEVSQKEVTDTFVRESDHINRLTIVDENGNEQIIETTDGHPFWVVTNDPDLSRAARDYSDGMYHGNLEVTDHGYWVEAKDL